MKRVLVLAGCLILMGTTPLYANYGEKGYHGDFRGQRADLSHKIYKKAHSMLAHEEDLGLSEKQVEAIKTIKRNTKKEVIMKEASIDVLKIDIQAKLHENPVDVEAIDPLIDQKYTLKKEKAKFLVKALADLKAVLSEKQYETLKEIWRKEKP